jgi:hypothetical protein
MGEEQLRRLPTESQKGLIEETRENSWQEVQVYKYADAPRMKRLCINSVYDTIFEKGRWREFLVNKTTYIPETLQIDDTFS